MSRSPAVANRFYPGEENTLKSAVRELLPRRVSNRSDAIGAVSPHAGYIYSGSVCAETLSTINIPETVVILGPNHHGQGRPLALSTTTWHMPMGDVPVNTEFSKALQKASTVIEVDESAHQFEHSLEVQIPILQALQKNLSIVPLVISHISYALCQEVAQALAATIGNYADPILMLASSDMSHYESRESASKKDRLALDRLEALDPEGLYQTVIDNRISMCGIIPVTIVLQAAMLLGANSAEVLTYTDSGVVSGDTHQVVGYAGAVIAKV